MIIIDRTTYRTTKIQNCCREIKDSNVKTQKYKLDIN